MLNRVVNFIKAIKVQFIQQIQKCSTCRKKKGWYYHTSKAPKSWYVTRAQRRKRDPRWRGRSDDWCGELMTIYSRAGECFTFNKLGCDHSACLPVTYFWINKGSRVQGHRKSLQPAGRYSETKNGEELRESYSFWPLMTDGQKIRLD